MDMKKWLTKFMEDRQFETVEEVANYIAFLEDVRQDHEVLKDKIANLNRLAQEMY